MSERACPRCGSAVLLEDGALVYCRHCGAPQIFLSEELQAEIAEGARVYREQADSAVRPDEPATDAGRGSRWSRLWHPRGVAGKPWSLGVRAALLTAAVALLLGLFSLLLPPIGLLLMLWVMTAPVLAVAFFHARLRAAEMPDTGFAARLGLLTGLLVTLCCIVVFALSLTLTRYVFHDAGLLDAQLAASFAQQRTVVMERLGPDAGQTLDLFAVPEYRVGLLLFVVGSSAAIYLLLAMFSAAVADALLRRRRVLPS